MTSSSGLLGAGGSFDGVAEVEDLRERGTDHVLKFGLLFGLM
jgi:hypothetical protein